MSARKRKAARQAAYRAGPLAPWRSHHYMLMGWRLRRKRLTYASLGGDPNYRDPPIEMEIGRVERFRFIISPTL